MNIGSIIFIAYSIFALVLWYGVPQISIRNRLLVINLVFVSSFVDSLLAIIPIAIFSVVGYCAIHIAASWRSNWTLFTLTILVLSLFTFTKRYTIIAELSFYDFLYTVVGISYLLFRIIHLMVDVYQGAINKAPGPIDYFNYLFFFLTFVSGPIQRYQEHQVEINDEKKPLELFQIREALARIITGFIKVIIVASVANEIVISLPLSMGQNGQAYLGVFNNAPAFIQSFFQSGETGASAIRFTVRFIVRSFAFLIYLYFNFSGYMDIVVGIGRLFNIRVAENFIKPFEAVNFLDFWSRWHVTLSGWFKIYMFNPLLKMMAEASPKGRSNAYLAVPVFFFTFLAMGVWHGTSYAFVVYGLLLGGGVSLNKLYQIVAGRVMGRQRYKALAADPIYRLFCRGMLVSYFALSLCCLWLDIEKLVQIYRLLGALKLITLLFFCSFLTAMTFGTWELILTLVKKWPAQVSRATFSLGLIYLASVWGNVWGFKTLLEQVLPGGGVPEPMIASLGVVLIVFSWAVSERGKELIPTVQSIQLSARVTMLLFVFLMYTGAVPEFVYKGF